MTFITSLALRRPTVAVLAAILVLASGVFAYRSLQIELFPQIEFPLVTVFATYPSAAPEAVVQEVTAPIERAITSMEGLEQIQSSSSEGNAAILATFKYGTNMAETESAIEAALNNIPFPAGVGPPTVGRINPDEFPIHPVQRNLRPGTARAPGHSAVAHSCPRCPRWTASCRFR